MPSKFTPLTISCKDVRLISKSKLTKLFINLLMILSWNATSKDALDNTTPVTKVKKKRISLIIYDN